MASQRDLFGGAITMNLPSNLVDASDLRQVPNTQEVFLSPDSDVSFVVEILQRVGASGDDTAAAEFHFDSLAQDNSATSQEILNIVLPSQAQKASPPATPHPIILVGKQDVQKFNSFASDEVNIFMALYRVEMKGVDVVFTVNAPQHSGEEALLKTERVFNSAVESFRILDFGLFV